jgi:hypothetical protein
MSMLFDGLLDSVCADALFNSEGTVARVTTDMAIIEIFSVELGLYFLFYSNLYLLFSWDPFLFAKKILTIRNRSYQQNYFPGR